MYCMSDSEGEPITLIRNSRHKKSKEIGIPHVIKGSGQNIAEPLQKNLPSSSSQLDLSVVEKAVTSTPLESGYKKRVAEELELKLNKEIEDHRKKLKSIRTKEKANNLEFLKILSIEMNEESILPMNDTEEVVWYKTNDDWINLTLYADPQPSKFGRHLASRTFGRHDNCRLMVEMIGCERHNVLTRKQVPKEDENIFRKVVELKYPREPTYAYSEARRAANSMGTQYRYKYPDKLKQLLQEQHQAMVVEKLQLDQDTQEDLDQL